MFMTRPGWGWDGARWVRDRAVAPDPCCDQVPDVPVQINPPVSFTPVPPLYPVSGQFWFDGKTLRLFDGSRWFDVGGDGGEFLGLSGGTLTGPLSISSTSPVLSLNALSSGQDRTILGTTNGLSRWAISLGDDEPETGGNSGCSFLIEAYSDAGAPISTPLAIRRDTGLAVVAGDPAVPLGIATKQYVDGIEVGGILGVNFYTVTQVIYIPPKCGQAHIKMWGATGGSAGITASTVSGGSGAGGYLEKFLTGLTPGNSMLFTCGLGGAAGTSGGGPGGTGGITTLASGTQSIPSMTCAGSVGSVNNVTGFSPGGTATGGDFNMTGQPGGTAVIGATDQSSNGGVTFYSVGAAGPVGGAAAAGNAGNPGGLVISWFQ